MMCIYIHFETDVNLARRTQHRWTALSRSGIPRGVSRTWPSLYSYHASINSSCFSSDKLLHVPVQFAMSCSSHEFSSTDVSIYKNLAHRQIGPPLAASSVSMAANLAQEEKGKKATSQ